MCIIIVIIIIISNIKIPKAHAYLSLMCIIIIIIIIISNIKILKGHVYLSPNSVLSSSLSIWNTQTKLSQDQRPVPS